MPIGHITNGVHVPTWLAPQMRQVYDRHLGPDWPQRCERRRRSGKRIDDDRRRRAVGDASDAQGAAHRLRAAPRRRSRPSARGESAGRRRAAAAGAEPRRADDRLRAPLRHLQARQPDPAGHRGASPSLVNDPQMPMQFVFAGKAHPHDRPGQGGAAADRAADARPALRRQDPVHRGLRHQRRPAPGAGRRRLAQQPAAAARGLRHQRPEGRAQRRPEPLGARRLVGRGLRRPERLRHRHAARRTRRPTCTTRATRDALLRRAARRGRSRSTTTAIATACRASGSRA